MTISTDDKSHPDLIVSIVRESIDRNGNVKTHWFQAGALWEGKNHTLNGETIYGRMVIKPYEPKQK